MRGTNAESHAVTAACQAACRALQVHGGASTGPRNKDGLARLTEARTKHGKFTKEKRAEAKRRADQGRQMRGELKELEAWFVENGHLDKNWRDQFK